MAGAVRPVSRGFRAATRALAALLALLPPAMATAAIGVLENPQPGAKASGIGIVSGYHCSAVRIDIEIDGAPAYRAGSGTPRADTQARCGRSDTGFSRLINWNTLGAGTHLVRALADGAEFARASANVITLGAEFRKDASGTLRLDNFPLPGKGVVAEWQEAQQNFVIRDYLQSVPSMNGAWFGPVLEQWQSCSDPAYNGNHGANATWSVAMFDDVNLSINGTIQTTPSFACSYTGIHALTGAQHAASGTFSCTNGKAGTWRTSEFTVTDRGLSLIGDGDWKQNGVSCRMKFLLGGYRHLPLP